MENKTQGSELFEYFDLAKLFKILQKNAWSMSFLPIILIVWALAQLGALSRFWAWYCFDWSQVPNDTALLAIPALASVAWWGILRFIKTASLGSRIISVVLVLVMFFVTTLFFLLGKFSIFFASIVSLSYFAWCVMSFRLHPSQDRIDSFLDSFEISKETIAKIIPALGLFALSLVVCLVSMASSFYFDQIYRKNIVIDLSGSLIPKDSAWFQLRYMNSKCVVFGSWVVRDRSDPMWKINFRSADFEVDLRKLADGKFSK